MAQEHYKERVSNISIVFPRVDDDDGATDSHLPSSVVVAAQLSTLGRSSVV